MAFLLDSVVPWGRNFQEYKTMFKLSANDLTKSIASFGDGPACFNYEASKQGIRVTSYDPIYQFSTDQLSSRIEQTRKVVMQQVKENAENYNWTNIPDPSTLEKLRMSAMQLFLEDFENGKKQGRYINHELPARINIPDHFYSLGLSSHFLLLYPQLGYDFHVQAISEMLRCCEEIRIFPVCDLDAAETDLAKRIIEYFEQSYTVNLLDTSYDFQKGDNKLLVISPK